jgi:tRNA-splicing ligase RtcB
MTPRTYDVLDVDGGAPIKAWTVGVPFEPEAEAQLRRIAALPFIHKWIAVMPDVHLGIGATVGSVIPTTHAIIPAAVGVDIGCGMMAVKTSLRAEQLPDNLHALRDAIEAAVPIGFAKFDEPSPGATNAWAGMRLGYETIIGKYPKLDKGAHATQLGTLGGGNHFIEVCLDEAGAVWLMLHSGSRGVGNRIGTFFIGLAKEDMRRWFIDLPDKDLAYFPEGSAHFEDYVAAVHWAQEYARMNRELMMQAVLGAVRAQVPPFEATLEVVNCHHNYVAREHHYGEDVLVTRKGAVRARAGDLGIIPGSMGARSYIVRGKGNAESFHSCSHGAGRTMSRTQAKATFTLADHAAATRGIECRKDAEVIDETPAAYKSIDAVMHAQRDLVDIVYALKQVLCIKG